MKSIIIIGAGIAGLSAGIYACKNGYDTTIYESHNLPGGMCTAWKRKGFTFEGCMHFIGLMGTSPEHVFYRMWEELGVLPGTRIINYDVLQIFRDTAGRTLNIYTDADRLEKELLSLSPADAREIRALCKTIKLYRFLIRTTGRNPFRFIANMAGILRAIPQLKKYGSMNLAEYAARYKDPLIRFAFTNLFIYPEFSCTNIFLFLSSFHIGSIGYPKGSSISIAKAVERTFLGLNGKIEYRKRVKRIIVEESRATGIELEDGTVKKSRHRHFCCRRAFNPF